MGCPVPKWPWVSRALYEAAQADIRLTRESAEVSLRELEARRTIIAQYSEWLANSDRRERDLMAKYAALAGRIADALDTAIRPAPVTVVQPDPTLADFPPDVGAALAEANAGFTKDVQRENYLWAKARMATKGVTPQQVAEELRHGLPVNIEVEYPD